mmetsp:Transcript_13520/g.25438  ORF Transcript_13520/g.25438 Transcript_13520/m.25438 type:complete len:120 (-) Transcript_13520:1668-2027(-)
MLARTIRRTLSSRTPVTTVDLITEVEDDKTLVTVPVKGMQWGQGGEVYQSRRVRFKKGKFPSIKRICRFLEVERAFDIESFDRSEQGIGTSRTFILASGFTGRHVSRMATNLAHEVYAT